MPNYKECKHWKCGRCRHENRGKGVVRCVNCGEEKAKGESRSISCPATGSAQHVEAITSQDAKSVLSVKLEDNLKYIRNIFLHLYEDVG